MSSLRFKGINGCIMIDFLWMSVKCQFWYLPLDYFPHPPFTAQSQDPETMTWAEVRHLTNWATQHPDYSWILWLWIALRYFTISFALLIYFKDTMPNVIMYQEQLCTRRYTSHCNYKQVVIHYDGPSYFWVATIATQARQILYCYLHFAGLHIFYNCSTVLNLLPLNKENHLLILWQQHFIIAFNTVKAETTSSFPL